MGRYYEGKTYDDPEEALADAQEILKGALAKKDPDRIVFVDDLSGKRKMASRGIRRGAVVGVLREAETAEFDSPEADADNRFQVIGKFADQGAPSDLLVIFTVIDYFDGEESVKIVTAYRPGTLTG